MPELTTPRLLLHPLTVDEAQAVASGSPLPGRPFAEGYPLPDTPDGIGLFLRHGVRDFGVYLAVRSADGLVIGDCGFVAPPVDGVVSIGYEIVPSARRRGHAVEAIRALAGWALRQPGVEEVQAETLPDNEASARALLRAGFLESEPGENVRRFTLRVSAG